MGLIKLLLITVSWCGFVLILTAAPGRTSGDPLADVAALLAAEITEPLNDPDVVIQLSRDSFREQGSERLLGLSRLLYDGLSAALSGRGVRVSLQEQGEEPLLLVGTYEIDADEIRIIVRLRRMGKTTSTELAVARAGLPRRAIAEDLLLDTLSGAVAGLVARLERQAPVVETMTCAVASALPLTEGQPTRHMGIPFTAEVADAVRLSEVFGGTLIGMSAAPCLIRPRYDIGADVVGLQLDLIGQDGAVQTSSYTTLPLERLPMPWLALQDTRGLDVCLTVRGSGRTDIKSGTRQADALAGYLGAELRKSGAIAIRSCGPDTAARDRTIVVQFSVASHRTADGYGLSRGQVRVDVCDNRGLPLGSLERVGQVSGDIRQGQIGRLFAAVMTPPLIEDLVKAVLAWRADDRGGE